MKNIKYMRYGQDLMRTELREYNIALRDHITENCYLLLKYVKMLLLLHQIKEAYSAFLKLSTSFFASYEQDVLDVLFKTL